MKKIVLSILLIFFACGSLFAQNTKDVVYLKNGGIIKGIIIEQIPNQSIKIQTSDGSVFVYTMDEVEKFGKEQFTQTSFNEKSPVAAWALSFLMPGCGQFYNGEGTKGGIMLGTYLVSSGVFWFVSWPIGLTGMLATAIWSQIDAPISANRINRQNSSSLGLNDGLYLGDGMFLNLNSSVFNTADLGMCNGIASGFNLSLSF